MNSDGMYGDGETDRPGLSVPPPPGPFGGHTGWVTAVAVSRTGGGS